MIDPLTAAATGKALVSNRPDKPDELTAPAARYAEQITGKARSELGGWFADHIRLRRFRSQLGILTKAQEYADAAGFQPQVVNLKLLVPLLEAGSLEEEDDEEMAGRWAALLANASREDGDSRVPPSFPDVLRQLTSVDAAILDLLYSGLGYHPPEERAHQVALGETLRESLNLDEVSFTISVENLYRLRVASPPSTRFDFVEPPGSEFQTAGTRHICLTDFGNAFVSACLAPSAKG